MYPVVGVPVPGPEDTGLFGLASFYVYTGEAPVDITPEDDLRLAARVDVPVLVTAGTRQERDRYARFIHHAGGGRGPFVTFSIDDVGSAAGLILRRHFDEARGGTLFIDDVATLSVAAQRQLFSILLEERLSRASSLRPVNARVRLVSGASHHLDTERATGAFCPALFYRLNLSHIDLMPQAH